MIKRGGVLGVVQCKRWQNVVGEPIVRDLYGAMHDQHANRAFLVTTGDFSSAARYWATGKPIELWDGQRLAEIASTGTQFKSSTSPVFDPLEST